MNFYRCNHCGTIVEEINTVAVPVCCGEQMALLVPGTSDGAVEKHVPVCTVNGNKVEVTVGSVIHPMLDAHYIEWIAIETTKGSQRKILKPGEEPKAEFLLADGEKFVAAYAYCNLHGLWKSE